MRELTTLWRRHLIAQVMGLVLLMAAPFVTYSLVSAVRPEPKAPWPAPVAVLTAAGDALLDLAVLDLQEAPVVVRLPLETALDVPNAGRLRAVTAFGIGGARLVTEALQATLGIDIPYWVEQASAGAVAARHNLGGHATDVLPLLEGERRLDVFYAKGEWRTAAGLRVFDLDAAAIQSGLRDPSARMTETPSPVGSVRKKPPSASMTPSPTESPVDRKAIRVEVLNRSGIQGAARATADRLQRAGFTIVTVGNSNVTGGDGTVVYYATEASHGAEVVEALDVDGLEPERLPNSYQTRADVLVLVGRS